MNFKSVSNMLQKFSANDFMKSHNCSLKQYHSLKSQVSESIEKILGYFGNIEKKIDNYVSQSTSLKSLEKVYQVLSSNFSSFSTRTTYEQFLKLFKDVRLGKFE